MDAARTQPENFKVEHLFKDIFAGTVIGFIEVIFAISFASLIFNGPLASYISLGVGLVLITAISNLIIIALFSKSPHFIGSIQDNTTVLLAIVVTGLVAATSQDQLLPTVLVAIVISTTSTGLFLFLIGRFKLGGLARYVPYPVIGGFLAGTGWLLMQGGFSIMIDSTVTLSTIDYLMQPSQLIMWMPGIAFSLIIFFALYRFNHHLILPGIMIAGIVVFYLVIAVFGISIADARQMNFLLDSSNNAGEWQIISPNMLSAANWTAIFAQVGNIAVIAIVALLGALLNISGIELALKEDVDLDHELQSVGTANIVSGLLGGFVGYHASSLSVLGSRMGATSRFASIFAGIICLGVLLAGAPFLVYVPRPFLGGVIFFLGLDFFYDWVIQGYKKFPTIDFVLVLVILIVIAFYGFLVGVALGLVMAIILFVINYSQIPIFQYQASGAELSSNVERPAYHEKSLLELGRHVYIMELKGFIFFGTVNRILKALEERLHDPDDAPLEYCVLDFKRVTGVDSSAILGFAKLKSLAKTYEFTIIFTAMGDKISEALGPLGTNQADDENIKQMEDLDRALSWCEDTLIYEYGVTQAHIASTLGLQLADLDFDKNLVNPLKNYLERLTFQADDILMEQGEDADRMYFIEVGQVSIYIEPESGQKIRVRTMQMGTVVGEIGFYQNSKRTATVVADTMTIAFCLTRQNFDKMKKEDPGLAIAVNELLVRIIADRLNRLNKQLIAMSR